MKCGKHVAQIPGRHKNLDMIAKSWQIRSRSWYPHTQNWTRGQMPIFGVRERPISTRNIWNSFLVMVRLEQDFKEWVICSFTYSFNTDMWSICCLPSRPWERFEPKSWGRKGQDFPENQGLDSSGLRLHLGMVGNQHDKVPMLGFCGMSYFCPELLSDLVWQTGKCITQLSLQEDLLQTGSLVGHSSTSISSSSHTEQRLERNEPKC